MWVHNKNDKKLKIIILAEDELSKIYKTVFAR